MAANDNWPYAAPWPWVTNGSTCAHGSFPGNCFYCQHPATGQAPQTLCLGGWVCAGCHHGYAPSVTECPRCPQRKAAVPAEDFTGGPEHDLCVPLSEGGLCDHDGKPQGCNGGRHCSC